MESHSYVGLKKVARKKRWKSFAILLVVVALTAAATYAFVSQQDSDESDPVATTTTSATTTTVAPTTTTQPEDAIASVDLVAEGNDSNATAQRLNTDFAGQVTVTQVSTDTAIAATVVVINNTLFDILGQQIAETLQGTVGTAPAGHPASTADIIVYVKN